MEYFEKIKQAAEAELSKHPNAGHDINHVMRVYHLATTIAKKEKDVDIEVLQATTLLHDIGGPKEISDPSGGTCHAIVGAEMAEPILKKLNFPTEKITHVQDCIVSHRSKTESKPKTIEAKIVFDADKLDSIGAIGIARAFCWVGDNNANIYKKPNIEEYIKENMQGKINGRIQDKTKHSPQIEFEVKYTFLIDKLYTETARDICRERIQFFKHFLDRMEREIHGEL
jgi:uncharacterized protein